MTILNAGCTTVNNNFSLRTTRVADPAPGTDISDMTFGFTENEPDMDMGSVYSDDHFMEKDTDDNLAEGIQTCLNDIATPLVPVAQPVAMPMPEYLKSPVPESEPTTMTVREEETSVALTRNDLQQLFVPFMQEMKAITQNQTLANERIGEQLSMLCKTSKTQQSAVEALTDRMESCEQALNNQAIVSNAPDVESVEFIAVVEKSVKKILEQHQTQAVNSNVTKQDMPCLPPPVSSGVDELDAIMDPRPVYNKFVSVFDVMPVLCTVLQILTTFAMKTSSGEFVGVPVFLEQPDRTNFSNSDGERLLVGVSTTLLLEVIRKRSPETFANYPTVTRMNGLFRNVLEVDNVPIETYRRVNALFTTTTDVSDKKLKNRVLFIDVRVLLSFVFWSDVKQSTKEGRALFHGGVVGNMAYRLKNKIFESNRTPSEKCVVFGKPVHRAIRSSFSMKCLASALDIQDNDAIPHFNFTSIEKESVLATNTASNGRLRNKRKRSQETQLESPPNKAAKTKTTSAPLPTASMDIEEATDDGTLFKNLALQIAYMHSVVLQLQQHLQVPAQAQVPVPTQAQVPVPTQAQVPVPTQAQVPVPTQAQMQINSETSLQTSLLVNENQTPLLIAHRHLTSTPPQVEIIPLEPSFNTHSTSCTLDLHLNRDFDFVSAPVAVSGYICTDSDLASAVPPALVATPTVLMPSLVEVEVSATVAKPPRPLPLTKPISTYGTAEEERTGRGGFFNMTPELAEMDYYLPSKEMRSWCDMNELGRTDQKAWTPVPWPLNDGSVRLLLPCRGHYVQKVQIQVQNQITHKDQHQVKPAQLASFNKRFEEGGNCTSYLLPDGITRIRKQAPSLHPAAPPTFVTPYKYWAFETEVQDATTDPKSPMSVNNTGAFITERGALIAEFERATFPVTWKGQRIWDYEVDYASSLPIVANPPALDDPMWFPTSKTPSRAWMSVHQKQDYFETRASNLRLLKQLRPLFDQARAERIEKGFPRVCISTNEHGDLEWFPLDEPGIMQQDARCFQEFRNRLAVPLQPPTLDMYLQQLTHHKEYECAVLDALNRPMERKSQLRNHLNKIAIAMTSPNFDFETTEPPSNSNTDTRINFDSRELPKTMFNSTTSTRTCLKGSEDPFGPLPMA